MNTKEEAKEAAREVAADLWQVWTDDASPMAEQARRLAGRMADAILEPDGSINASVLIGMLAATTVAQRPR